MNREQFQEFFEKNRGKFITGIHNYCDRWCERCAFTSKCSVFAMDEQRSNKTKDNPEAFVEAVSDNFKLVMEMLVHMAEEKGIDLNNLEEDAEYEMEEKKREEFADKHILSIHSKDYSDRGRNWFQENENVLKTLSDKLNQDISLGLTSENILKDVDAIEDAIEIIHWFNFQIYVKLMRALRHGELDLEYEDPIQNDINGSAKVALLGTERSLAAWGGFVAKSTRTGRQYSPYFTFTGKDKNRYFKNFPRCQQVYSPGF